MSNLVRTPGAMMATPRADVERRGDPQSTALVAQARAAIEARYIMAVQRPRDDDEVRVRMLHLCKKPSFAARAIYSLPRGNKPGRLTGTANRIEGLTVRFAENAIRLSGNLEQETRTVSDDPDKRLVNVRVTDLETNASYGVDIVIDKTVERQSPKQGAIIVGQRTNSAGGTVFIVQSTEDELAQKQASLVSKALRTLALRFLPADTLEECERAIVETVRAEDARDPDAAKKQLTDAFVSLGVYPTDLEAYLGHPVAQSSPAELQGLRGLYCAVRDGECTFAEALGATATAKRDDADADTAAVAQAQKIVDAIRARAAGKKPTATSSPEPAASSEPDGAGT